LNWRRGCNARAPAASRSAACCCPPMNTPVLHTLRRPFSNHDDAKKPHQSNALHPQLYACSSINHSRRNQ
jgi:hypothetical protein